MHHLLKSRIPNALSRMLILQYSSVIAIIIIIKILVMVPHTHTLIKNNRAQYNDNKLKEHNNQ